MKHSNVQKEYTKRGTFINQFSTNIIRGILSGVYHKGKDAITLENIGTACNFHEARV